MSFKKFFITFLTVAFAAFLGIKALGLHSVRQVLEPAKEVAASIKGENGSVTLRTQSEEVSEAATEVRQEEAGGEQENVPAEISVESGYYYGQLSGEEQRLYRDIYEGIKDAGEVFSVETAVPENVGRVYESILCDRPELFWCTGEMQITAFGNYAELAPSYSCTGTELDRKRSEIEQAAQRCIAGMPKETVTEYEKIKYVFEYIVDQVDYELGAADSQNIYSALVNRRSVCAGYSRAVQYLLQKLGITCIYVTGEIPGQGPHAWNIVQCDGEYYHLDATFADPVFQREGQEAQSGGVIYYDYLCCDDAQIMKNHVPDTSVAYPECSSDRLNYYRLHGMYYDRFSAEELQARMDQSITDKEKEFVCKFSNEEAYSQACDAVFGTLLEEAAKSLARQYGLSTVSYSYMKDDEMYKIVILWNYEA